MTDQTDDGTTGPITCSRCGEPKPATIHHLWACCGDGPGYGDAIKPEKLACVTRQLRQAESELAEAKSSLETVKEDRRIQRVAKADAEIALAEARSELEAERARVRELEQAARFVLDQYGYGEGETPPLCERTAISQLAGIMLGHQKEKANDHDRQQRDDRSPAPAPLSSEAGHAGLARVQANSPRDDRCAEGGTEESRAGSSNHKAGGGSALGRRSDDDRVASAPVGEQPALVAGEPPLTHDLNEFVYCVRCKRFDPANPCPGKPAAEPPQRAEVAGGDNLAQLRTELDLAGKHYDRDDNAPGYTLHLIRAVRFVAEELERKR